MNVRRGFWSIFLAAGLVIAMVMVGPVSSGLHDASALAQERARTAPAGQVPDTAQLVAQQELPEGPPSPQEQLDELGISGYADPLSVQPGDDVPIMVSTTSAEFRATMVRVVHGDADPRGPGIKEEVIDAPVNGEYPGEHQVLPLGSYVTVPDDAALRPAGSFTITAWIAPTTIPGSKLNAMAMDTTPAGTPRPQGIITKWSDDTGYGLFLDDQGSLSLWLAGADGQVDRVRTGVPLRPWAPGFESIEDEGRGSPIQANESGWYFVAATYNAETGEVHLQQEPVTQLPDPTAAAVTEDTAVQGVAHTDSPLLMAAYGTESPGNPEVGGFFNGKIDGPRFFDRTLTADELDVIRTGGSAGSAVASWDFSQRVGGSTVVDTSPQGLNGVAVNNPVRAVTSHNWAANEQDFKDAPEQYNAMYFHEDALGDSAWEPSFSFTVPEDARSGFYAAKLEADGNTYYVSFFVRPTEPTSNIAFLVPTFSYLAYADTGTWLSQYDVHADGAGVVYSTHLRPLTDQRVAATGPDGEGRPWQYEADTHLTDWLESTGYDVDYITDHDLHREGASLLEPYDVVLTGTHPEYTSTQMWDGLHEWLNGGGRLMYMGGNGFYWITTLDETEQYTELRRHDGSEAWQAAPGEYYHSTTGEYGGLWRFRGRHPQELVGVGFSAQGFSSRAGPGDYNRPYTRAEGSRSERGSWVFEGVSGNTIGDFPTLQNPGGPAGEELDRVEYALGTPADTVVLAVADDFGDEYLHVVEELLWSNLMQGGSVNPLVRADMTLMYYPQGGAVWSTSSIAYAGSLFYNDYANQVSTITGNVLDKFASGEALPDAPGD